MGCNVSRLDSHGPTFPAKLRPLLFQRFNEIKARRYHASHPLKDPTPSKKELLSPDDNDKNNDNEINASQHLLHTPNSSNINPTYATMDEKDHDVLKENVVMDGGCEIETKKGMRPMEENYDRVKAKADDVFTDEDENMEDNEDAVDDGDDNDDDYDVRERRVGRGEDGSFPTSPSFRDYFKGNDVVDDCGGIANNDISKKKPVSSPNCTPAKESFVEKKVKKGKKKRSFRKVLPKNLLGVKSCYTPSSHSQTSSHGNTNLSREKMTT